MINVVVIVTMVHDYLIEAAQHGEWCIGVCEKCVEFGVENYKLICHTTSYSSTCKRLFPSLQNSVYFTEFCMTFQYL